MRFKSFLFSALALAAGLFYLNSCSLDPEQAPQLGPVTEEADFLITTENPATKTVFDGAHTLWAEGDRITAIDIEDGGDQYYASSMTYRGDNVFGGRVTYAGDVNNWYLIYPYREDNVTPKETHIHVPEVQTQDGNDDMSHIAGVGFPLIGKELAVSRASQLHVTMRNVLARLDFKVTNTTGSALVFKQVVFTAPSDICGDFVGDITNDTPSWTAEGDAFRSMTLNIEDGSPVAAGSMAQFHAGVAPFTVPAGGSIKAKVVAVNPTNPGTEIVFYHIFNIQNATALRPGMSYSFNVSFDAEHGEDPTPDDPVYENQVLSFDQTEVTWQLGNGYAIGSSYDVQAVNGARTDVSYTSSDPRVATIDGTRITIQGTGATDITANAAAGNGYNAASSKYTLYVTSPAPQTGTVYVKANSITPGGTYLVVDIQDQRLMKGDTDGSFVSVSPVNGVITDSNNSLSGYEFTVTQSGGKYCILKDGKYLICDYSTSGNSSTGLVYESTKPADNYLYSLTVSNGAFEFVTAQRNSSSTNEVLYFKSSSNLFKIGGSGNGIGVHLYLKDASATPPVDPVIPVDPSGPYTYEYTAPGDLVPGNYLITGSESNELSVALFPTVNTGSWNSTTTGQVSNGQYIPHKVIGTNNSVTTLTTEDSEVIASEVVLAKSGNNWTVQVKSTGLYLVVPSQDYRVSYANSGTAFSISSGSNGATIQSGGYYFYHSGAADGFSFRTNSTSNVRFYRRTSGSGGTTPTPSQQTQTLTSPGAVTWTIGNGYQLNGTYTLPQVSGNKTAVSYSSTSSIISISGTSVTIRGTGTASITATAVATSEYSGASVTYTLTIRPAQQGNTFSIENDMVASYLDRVESEPYDTEDYSYTYVTNYSSGTGQNNRLDWPKPVPVSWTNPSSGNSTKVVYIYNDSSMNDLEMTVDVNSSSSTSADVYNLIPNRTYYYRVTNGGNVLTTGSFNTTGRRRMMRVGTGYSDNDANNCRDLGGQVTTSGKTIKYGILYRGTNIDNTAVRLQDYNAEARSILLDYMKIELDVDLRETTGANPLGILVSDETYNSMDNLTNKNKMGKTLKDIFDAVAAGKHAYIHCKVGADRTGFVCMVLEGLLGVPQNMCDVDYEMTSFAGHPGTRTRRTNGGWNDPNYYYSGSGKGVTYINNTYSGSTFQERVINFVKAMGLSQSDITAFQNNMLE